jgi:hypothetical protein
VFDSSKFAKAPPKHQFCLDCVCRVALHSFSTIEQQENVAYKVHRPGSSSNRTDRTCSTSEWNEDGVEPSFFVDDLEHPVDQRTEGAQGLIEDDSEDDDFFDESCIKSFDLHMPADPNDVAGLNEEELSRVSLLSSLGSEYCSQFLESRKIRSRSELMSRDVILEDLDEERVATSIEIDDYDQLLVSLSSTLEPKICRGSQHLYYEVS